MNIKIGDIVDLPAGLLNRARREAKYPKLYSLPVGGFIEISDKPLWQKMRQVAHTHASRAGKSFRAKWCSSREERAEAMEETGKNTSFMDKSAKGYIWRIK